MSSCLTNTGPFQYLQPDLYWSGTEYAPKPTFAWLFYASQGYQNGVNKEFAIYALAVRPGDVAAAGPEPQPLTLARLGLAALWAARRRRAH